MPTCGSITCIQFETAGSAATGDRQPHNHVTPPLPRSWYKFGNPAMKTLTPLRAGFGLALLATLSFGHASLAGELADTSLVNLIDRIEAAISDAQKAETRAKFPKFVISKVTLELSQQLVKKTVGGVEIEVPVLKVLSGKITDSQTRITQQRLVMQFITKDIEVRSEDRKSQDINLVRAINFLKNAARYSFLNSKFLVPDVVKVEFGFNLIETTKAEGKGFIFRLATEQEQAASHRITLHMFVVIR